MENSLRVFVYVILKTQHHDKWTDLSISIAEEETSTISAVASKRIAQAGGFGYLGYPITSPLMFLNSGEIIRLILAEANWKFFKPYFRASKDVVKTKFDEIGTVRNSLAHYRPIRSDDVELIKQNIRHTFIGIDECLSNLVETTHITPTNTDEPWYVSLSSKGNETCSVRLFQSKKVDWIRILINYTCLQTRGNLFGTWASYNILTINTPNIAKEFNILRRFCTCISDGDTIARAPDGGEHRFSKSISMVFSKSILNENHEAISSEFDRLLNLIQKETDLIRDDHLAQGRIIERVSVSGSKSDQGDYWIFNTDGASFAITEGDPPEYWGKMTYWRRDFIAGSRRYPWSPADISKEGELPF